MIIFCIVTQALWEGHLTTKTLGFGFDTSSNFHKNNQTTNQFSPSKMWSFQNSSISKEFNFQLNLLDS